MKVKPYKGKQYEIGKYYEFSDDEDFIVNGCFGAKLKDVDEGSLYPFKASFGASYSYCREIAGSLGKITKQKITPEVGKLYKVADKESLDYVLWREATALACGWEIICEMVEKEGEK